MGNVVDFTAARPPRREVTPREVTPRDDRPPGGVPRALVDQLAQIAREYPWALPAIAQYFTLLLARPAREAR